MRKDLIEAEADKVRKKVYEATGELLKIIEYFLFLIGDLAEGLFKKKAFTKGIDSKIILKSKEVVEEEKGNGKEKK